MKTCKNCGERDDITCQSCISGPLRGWPPLANWRPRPWTIVLKLSLSAIALVLIACGVLAYLDQAQIDATPKGRLQSTDFIFAERVYYMRGGREHWRVCRTVVWTIYNCASERGYFISEGD